MNIYIGGFFFISIIGTLLHFTYDFSNHNKIVGLFSAVNESTWEHIKIALTPLFVWSLIDGYLLGKLPNYFISKLVGILIIIIVIPLIFYGYKYFTKKSILFIDISSFYFTILLSQWLSYLVIIRDALPYIVNYISVIVIFIIFGFYMTATLVPLKLFIFKDPLTKKYGYIAHQRKNC
ncbi:MAG: DUF6512 family protein [bacterium]|nr:DUF6512 family protein [bacterium]